MLKTKLLVLMILGLLNPHLGCAQVPPVADESKGVPAAEFVISGGYILIPEGSFVLVRKGREMGAIRFTKIERDAKGNGKATYESYFQGNGPGSFGSNVAKRSGEIIIKPMKGFHSLAWQPGQDKLWVGNWWFGCLGPSLMNMSSGFAEKDKGFEFAPTSAESVADIDASDKRLRWFRYEADMRIKLPVSDLAK